MANDPIKPVTPGEIFERGEWVAKAIEAINSSIRKSGPRDQYSFDYTWIAKACGNSSRTLPKQLLKKLVSEFNEAGWHAWLYEHGRDISGVAEDPAFVLDAPKNN